jgi:epoxyqueuosine reductase
MIKAGLMVSYRGALALKEWIDLPDAPVAAPCAIARRPALTACPVNALSPKGYDAAACHSYLDNDPGTECIQLGLRRTQGLPLERELWTIAAAVGLSHAPVPSLKGRAPS